jgi:uncharacterized protein (TIGR02466 family)
MMTNAAASGQSRHAQLPPLLRKAVTAHEAGRLEQALPLYRQFVDQNPRHPTALQLLGVLHSQRGEYEAAITLMQQSLQLFPQQAEVANNLGNALSRSGRLDEALESYAEAVRLRPRYADALRNLGLGLLEKDRLEDATNCFQCCVDIEPNDAAAWLCLGNAHKRRNDFRSAIPCYERALELRPDYAEAHHNLGVCLRIENRPEDAIPHYEAAREGGLDRAELYHNLGNALADLGNTSEAIDAYRASLARNPHNRDCHRNLSSLLWQQELPGDHLESYRQALLQDPAAVSLRLDLGMALNQQGMYGEAERVLAQGLRHAEDRSELKSLLAYTLENQGRWPEALQLHAAAVATPGASPNLSVSYARALLAAGRPDEALVHAKLGAARMPFNQRALAYLSLCWRMLGDERDKILNDYENLIGVFDVPVPQGYSDTDTFNSRLNEVLGSLHTGKRPPPEQTVRGGTQTSGDLFTRREPEIAGLVDGLKSCIREYIERLPGHPEHPMLSRRSEDFAFSASWSVRLQSAGFHTMHIHPLGWISSAYYVQVPPEVAGPNANEGVLKFGEPDIDIGAKGEPRRHIQPVVGRLVLFPSYMWHGTVPFDSGQPRTTVAFDVVPAVKQ